nr:UDP-glucuronosyltransferase 2B31-like [Onthophagus taurus]
MKFALITFLIINYFKIIENANILAILPYPGKSHFTVFKPILKNLADRGHEVDVMSHFPLKKSHKRYNDISLEGVMEIKTNNIKIEELKNTNFYENINVIYKIAGVEMCEALLNSQQARDLLNSTKRYDLMITQVTAGDCMYGFGDVFKVPIVAITTSVNLPWVSDRMALPDNPAYIPNYFSSFEPQMNFFQRFWNSILLLTTKFSYHIHQQSIEKIAEDFFGNKISSSIKDISKNVSLVLVNSHFSIQQSRPLVPNFVEIAGIHIEKDFSLPSHFETLLNSTKIIYLSFGSMIMTETLPEHILKSIFETFKALEDYKILWKADKDLFPKELEIPSNVQFEKWMPQLGILCHPNTKLFISHGGMLGTQEANYCGVPVLGIPIFADQFLNINNNVAKGIALGIEFNKITNKSFSKVVNTLLGKNFKDKAEEISKKFIDRPLSALDTAIYWIEYVIRHNGAEHLRSDAVKLEWYQYYLLDVIGFSLIILAVLFVILWFLFKWLIGRVVLVLGKKRRKIKLQ